ncbi:MAG: hypothetical protein ACI4Q7_01590 [Candidatus Avelusimicrobium sp.]
MTFYGLVGILGVLLMASSTLEARPRTEVSVEKPVTSVQVSRPTTSSSVFHPKTSVQVIKPATSVTVNHPKTESVSYHPVTQTVVSRPVTSVQALHPAEQVSPNKGEQTPSKSGKQAAAVPSSASSTSMSGYQPPKATNFKASNLSGGENGLGNKTNEAAKDAAAASLNIPKGQETSLVEILKKSGELNNSSVAKGLEKILKK